MGRGKYDVVSENFELYFDETIQGMSQQQREEFPKDIYFKQNKRTGTLRAGKTTFAEKLAVLWKVFNRSVYIVIQDDNEGFLADDLLRYEKELKTAEYGESEVKDFKAKAKFVLGADDVCFGMHYQFLASKSKMFKFLTPFRGTNSNEIAAADKASRQVASMLYYYECMKKKMVRDTGITVPEWYVLLYIFRDGVQKTITQAYDGAFADAFNGSRAQIIRAVTKLSTKGLIKRTGPKKRGKYQTTTIGNDMVYNILSKYILNF